MISSMRLRWSFWSSISGKTMCSAMCRRPIPVSYTHLQGRVSLGEEPVGKLILEKAVPFSKIPRELWIKFSDMEDYRKGEQKLLDSLSQSEGNDAVVIYLEKERAKKILPVNWNVEITTELTELLSGRFGEANIRIVEKKI